MTAHGSHGAGEVAESSIFRLVGSRKRVLLGLAWVSDTPQPTPVALPTPKRSRLPIVPFLVSLWEVFSFRGLQGLCYW